MESGFGVYFCPSKNHDKTSVKVEVIINCKTKAKTFELFRRNCKDIEILTYDELFDRAYFIVNQTENDPNLPF